MFDVVKEETPCTSNGGEIPERKKRTRKIKVIMFGQRNVLCKGLGVKTSVINYWTYLYTLIFYIHRFLFGSRKPSRSVTAFLLLSVPIVSRCFPVILYYILYILIDIDRQLLLWLSQQPFTIGRGEGVFVFTTVFVTSLANSISAIGPRRSCCKSGAAHIPGFLYGCRNSVLLLKSFC